MPDEKQNDEEPKDTEEKQEATEALQGEPAVDEKVEAPEAKFTILVSSIATQVLVSLGAIENPLTKKKETDLKSAKFSIDLLQTLADKTRGNLTKAEESYLENVLYQLRMGYVEASK